MLEDIREASTPNHRCETIKRETFLKYDGWAVRMQLHITRDPAGPTKTITFLWRTREEIPVVCHYEMAMPDNDNPVTSDQELETLYDVVYVYNRYFGTKLFNGSKS